jgi:hypothetical protein
LASAFGYVDLLKLKAKNKEEIEHIENISKSIRNILEKINNVY